MTVLYVLILSIEPDDGRGLVELSELAPECFRALGPSDSFWLVPGTISPADD